MARSGGSFGGSLNPLGSGTLGSLSQYDIGADLADLAVYETEVAYGNGLVSDEVYVAALQKAVDATDPETHRRAAAQNKLDDATYRIGRSKADEKGLDDLIAYDQAAVAKMTPDNLRYRDVKQSLDSELAQRRSRDYGKLVDDYNDGKTSTNSLFSWVKRTLGTLTPDDPDFDNWTGVQTDLEDRLANEKDAKVYQDYQQDRMKAPAFLAYLTSRRDSYDHSSPKWADWDRRLEDARGQVEDKEQGQRDSAFFNKYEEGKVSDASYLKYLRSRIAGMDPDDPQLGEWKHRLHQAAFSLAEDQLRFDVEHHKAPVSKLVSFYRNYRNTLNPGSAEYRQITRALDVISRGGVGGGGGGGGGGTKGSGSPAAGLVNAGKQISPKYSLETALSLMAIDPTAKSKDQRAAKKWFDLNYTSLDNARQRGDAVWLFYDPRKPGATVQARNPDGTPVIGTDGKPVLVRGSSYLPVQDQAFANMNMLQADYHYRLAEVALHDHDASDYAYNLKLAINAQDKARFVQSQFVQHSNQAFYDAAQEGIDLALKTGDYATAINLARDLGARLKDELANPMLDDTRRDKLSTLGDKVFDNPLLPKFDPNLGTAVGGAVNLASSSRDKDGNFTNVVLNPGWHHLLDNTNSKTGQSEWGLVFDDRQDGTWEANHVAVHTAYGNRVVTGEVKVSTAPTSPTVVVRTPDGMLTVPDSGARFMSFTDEHGQLIRAYSLDGRSWIRSTPGTPLPVVSVDVDLTRTSDSDGTFLIDPDGEKVFQQNADGSWRKTDYFTSKPEAMSWFGQHEYESRSAGVTKFSKRVATDAVGAAGSKEWMKAELRYAKEDVGSMSVGAPGQHMLLATLSDDGAVNLLPSALEPKIITRDELRLTKSSQRDDRSGYRPFAYTPKAKDRSRPNLGDGGLMDFTPTGSARSSRAGEDTGFSFSSQLPPNTPSRYEGRGLGPVRPPVPVKKGPSTLPGLTPPPAMTPPARLRDGGLMDFSLPGASASLPPLPKVSSTPKLPSGKRKPVVKKKAPPKPPTALRGPRLTAV